MSFVVTTTAAAETPSLLRRWRKIQMLIGRLWMSRLEDANADQFVADGRLSRCKERDF